ncbi:hypothetical protein DFH08DRAFT_978466 [Mycena albidolilacea]|uniref:DUF6534 domain-containing protein n=1 Tax=Mycena albidolilacea TaxID=1033008 RepID=A0AAD6YZ88_9AGAR|nr:hypothetical protein DFH08DRAFT_978466 [Mycena albidolilacea]
MSFNLDIVLGPLLVGTWANSALYTVEVIQAAYYYRHFKQDNWMWKLLVSSAIAIDSVSMIANYASVYLPYPLYMFTTGTVAALAQSFLVTRYWLLTRNKVLTLTLFFFITVAVGGAFASAATIAIFPVYQDREKAVVPATIWLITGVVTDVSIALALLLEFRKVKSSFKETRSLLNRLVAQTIQTGTGGATIALVVLVVFLVNNDSNVPTGVAYCLGRVYCITMLANLNSKKAGNTWSSKGTSSGANLDTRGERGNLERSEGGDEYGGIHVHRTAMVHIETPQEISRGSFKTNGRPDDSPAVEMEMTVNDSASYSSRKKQDLFAP